MSRKTVTLTILGLILAMIVPVMATAQPAAADDVAEITLLHTNDFHGRLETDYRGRGGSAYISDKVNDIRAAVGEENVALFDAGDVYFAAPAISQLLMGESTIDIYNMIGYELATFGNHEFDKGQDELAARVAQSEFPWLGANVVLEGTDWDLPTWAKPYEILELGAGPNAVKLGVLGLAGEETPEVTLLGTTAGLVFKDLTETILHYYDEILVQADADALVVLVHMGTNDSGPYDGLETVAQALIDAGKPVDLMIGGHQHQALFEPVWVEDTAIVSAGYYGRWLGQVDVSIDKAAKQLTVVNYQLNTITAEVTIEGLIADLEEMYEKGDITNKGVFNSLMKKLEGVADAFAKDNATAAANKLDAFANEVAAQAGKKIDADAAGMLRDHVEWYLENTDLSVTTTTSRTWVTSSPTRCCGAPTGTTTVS